jgi:hypothetical protein
MENTLPKKVLDAIRRHQKGGASAEACRDCSSSCCSRGGFALLENVVKIYGLYNAGKINRLGYRFPRGLSFERFVHTYFDVWTRNMGTSARPREMLFFHPRSLTITGHIIAIPEGKDYYEERNRFFAENPGLNTGCVFLSEPVPPWPTDDGRPRRCLLHDRRSLTHLTAKPIDCVYHVCEKPFTARDPSITEAREWFRTLEQSYPGSVGRYRAMIRPKPRAARLARV